MSDPSGAHFHGPSRQEDQPLGVANGAVDTAAQAAPPLTAEETVEARQIHPDARALFRKLPFLRYVPNFGTAAEAFGPKCTISVAQSEFLCKGIADYMILYSLLPMFTQRYQADAMMYQRMRSLRSMGWSVKAFTAMFSDLFSFFGYTKRWYLAVSCVVGAAFAVGYGLLPANSSSIPIAGAFVFITTFAKANVNILTQGHYSRLLRRVPAAGPSLVSWIWCWVLMGSLVASAVMGPLSDAHLERVGVFISAALQLLTTIFFVFNWYGERRNCEDRAEDFNILQGKLLEEQKTAQAKLQGDGECTSGLLVAAGGEHEPLGLPNAAPAAVEGASAPPLLSCCFGAFEVNTDVARRNWRIVLYCILMTIGSIAMVIVNLMGDKWQLLYACVSISVFLCGFGFFALRLVIAKANLYTFIRLVSYIQLPGALDSFYMAGPQCLPDGPHFSYVLYFTVGNVLSSIGGIIGVTLFTWIFSRRSYRFTFMSTAIVQILANIFDLIIVERWNRPYVSDKIVFVFGSSLVYEACNVLSYIPNIILLSQLCPRGSESMVYALLAGFSNFGQSISTTIGSLLMEFKWPVQSDPLIGPCDFSNVTWLLLVGHFLCRIVCVPLAYVLIPAARVCDDIDVDGKVIIRTNAAGSGNSMNESSEDLQDLSGNPENKS